MTVTLTATPEPDYTQPRIRLDVNDEAVTPITSVTITRQDASGRTATVRTSDGGPLTVSGGVAIVWDYEAPFGEPVTYSTDVTGGPTATTQLNVPDVWLIDPGVPSRSMAVPVVVDLGERTRMVNQGVFQILGRSTPIVVTGGPRSAPGGTLTVRTETSAQREALIQLLSGANPLFLNVPPDTQWGVDSCYIAIGDATESRTLDYGPFPWREWSLPYQVIARPGGGTQSAVTWAVVGAQYTWGELAATGLTWAELVAPTAS